MDTPIVKKFIGLVVDPTVRLLFAGAILYFVWGVFKYIRASDDPGERAAGGRHILYGVLGVFIMVSVWGIIAALQNTIGTVR